MEFTTSFLGSLPEVCSRSVKWQSFSDNKAVKMAFLNLMFYMSHFSIFGFVPIAVAQKRDNIVLIKLNETLSICLLS